MKRKPNDELKFQIGKVVLLLLPPPPYPKVEGGGRVCFKTACDVKKLCVHV